jgi:hypothetical protein
MILLLTSFVPDIVERPLESLDMKPTGVSSTRLRKVSIISWKLSSGLGLARLGAVAGPLLQEAQLAAIRIAAAHIGRTPIGFMSKLDDCFAYGAPIYRIDGGFLRRRFFDAQTQGVTRDAVMVR